MEIPAAHVSEMANGQEPLPLAHVSTFYTIFIE